MSILDELYHEWHTLREKPRKEEHAAWEHSEELWMQAENVLDAELFEELQHSVAELMDVEACREFEEGFRLGVQLMLEARTPGDPACITVGSALTSYNRRKAGETTPAVRFRSDRLQDKRKKQFPP